MIGMVAIIYKAQIWVKFTVIYDPQPSNFVIFQTARAFRSQTIALPRNLTFNNFVFDGVVEDGYFLIGTPYLGTHIPVLAVRGGPVFYGIRVCFGVHFGILCGVKTHNKRLPLLGLTLTGEIIEFGVRPKTEDRIIVFLQSTESIEFVLAEILANIFFQILVFALHANISVNFLVGRQIFGAIEVEFIIFILWCIIRIFLINIRNNAGLVNIFLIAVDIPQCIIIVIIQIRFI
jgi:hypothetical protein